MTFADESGGAALSVDCWCLLGSDAALLECTGPVPQFELVRWGQLVASEAAMDNARDATQVFGGYGFMNEYPVARHYRDSKILEIGEGTTEVQLMLIAREAGL